MTNVWLHKPIEGTVIPIEDTPDPVFAAKMLGPGLAIQPTEDLVVAPADGTLTLMYRTGHALVMTLDSGEKILIHIGIDTVSLDGEGFQVLAHQGEHVTAGTPLVRFDRELVRNSGRSTDVVVIIMENPNAQLEFA